MKNRLAFSLFLLVSTLLMAQPPQKLMQDGFDRETARQYYESLCSFYSLLDQKAMKVWNHSSSERISVEFLPLFEDIFAGKLGFSR